MALLLIRRRQRRGVVKNALTSALVVRDRMTELYRMLRMTSGLEYSGRQRVSSDPFLESRLASEQHHQLNHQNHHHHQLQHERPALIELVDHEVIELLGGFQFLLDEVFVVWNADF